MDKILRSETTEMALRKKNLESRLRELVGPALQREVLHVESFADPIDQIVSNADREIAGECLNREAHWIHDIRTALDKIHNNEYGQCESCDEPIGRRRLDAIPWARLCVNCQSAAEALGNRHIVSFDRAA